MAFNSLPQAWVNSGKFAIQSLWQYIKDNFDWFYSILGGLSVGGVVNASFEIDSDSDGVPDNWTKNLYAGGSGAIVSTESADGKYSYKFTHPGGAGNGGGYLTSDYINWSPYRMIGVVTKLRCSVAGIKVIVRVKFYDKDKAFLSNTDVYTSTANPTLWTLIYAKNIMSPLTARFAKIETHGGVDDTDVAGDVYFDFVQTVNSEPAPGYLPFTDSSIDQAEAGSNGASFTDVGTNQSITIPAGTKYLAIYTEVKVSTTDAGVGKARWRIGTTYSTEITTISTTYVGGWTYLDVAALQGAQTLRMQTLRTIGTAGEYGYGKSPAANNKSCQTGRIISDNDAGTQAFVYA